MPAETDPIRLFVAAALPEGLKDTLEELHPQYRHEAVRFVPRENLHLTVHFIGNFPRAQVPELEAKLRRLAGQHPSFRLRLQEVAPGPSLRNPRLIWARFAQNQVFEALSRALLTELGGNAKAHPHPVPHVTLARFRKDLPKPRDLPVEQSGAGTEIAITAIALWQSHLGHPHPQYAVLKSYPLVEA